MKHILSGIFAAAFALSASAVQAQDKPPLKIGGILDMSSQDPGAGGRPSQQG
jgi:branched-chain amino acid transport system substrate-binding protein